MKDPASAARPKYKTPADWPTWTKDKFAVNQRVLVYECVCRECLGTVDVMRTPGEIERGPDLLLLHIRMFHDLAPALVSEALDVIGRQTSTIEE